MILSTAAAVGGLGVATAARASVDAVLYVDNTNQLCSDTGAGSATQPFCTIGAAAAQVTAGQTVEVAGTTYPELVTVAQSGTATAPIVFTAAPGAQPTLAGADDGFLVSGQSYVTIEGFNVTQTVGDGIVIKNSSNVLIARNHVSYSGKPALNEAARGIRFDTVTDSVVEQNTVDHNTSYGIYINLGSTGDIVRDNNSFANAFGYQRAASGIRIHTSSGNTVIGNWSHNNEDSGMDLDKSTDNLVVDNVFTNNGDHGVDVTASSFRTTVTGNTVYKSVTAGINVEGTSTATITNNISVDNGVASPRTHSDIRVDVGSTDGTTLDYNEVYLTTPDMLFIWGSSSYTTLSAFQAATGQEAHGIQASPRWSDTANGDFHLTAGSPAIDSADSSAPGQTAADVEGYARVDDPVTVDSGVGVRSFDDRGAYEYHAPALDHVVVSPADGSLVAGTSESFTAEGYDAANNAIGDVTGSTAFALTPDGSCTGSACSATKAGAHMVTAAIRGVSGTAPLTVLPAALDHLALSPPSGAISSRGTVSYSAEGRDSYDNSLGDVTATTAFTISPNGSCSGSKCTASKAGPHTVTGTKSSKTGSATLQVLAGTSDHIVISPSPASITAGGSVIYTARSFDSAGNVIGDVTTSTSFSIAPDGSCSANVCSASKAGAHTATGINSGQTSTAALSVGAGPLDHLSLAPASGTISAGGAQTYTAQGRDAYDNPLGDLTAAAGFTISPDGSCTGSSCTATLAGPHTVTGNANGAGGTASLQVTASAVIDHVVISPATAAVTAGTSQSYSAQGYDSADNPIGDVTTSTTFSIGVDGSCTGNTCTATVAGRHTVTGSAGAARSSADLTVKPAALDHLIVTPAAATIASGGSASFTAEGRDRYDNSLGDQTAGATFAIAPNGSCTGATCTAANAGAHTVTVSEFGKTGTASLQVTSGTADHIVISPPSATMSAGDSQSYTAEGFDSAGNSLGDFTLGTTFTISPDGSCSGNVCSATAAGTHTVTGVNGGKTSSAVVTVTAGALDHFVLSPASATIVPGSSQTYTAYGRDQYENKLGDQTAITTFTIDPDGSCSGATCTASVDGSHTVTATVGEITGSATLQVTEAAAIDHIVVSPSPAAIGAGDTQTYSAEAFDAEDNSLGDVSGSTMFTISPDGSCSGNVCTATTAGAHTVTGTAVGKSDSAALTVSAGPLDHLTLSPSSALIAPDNSQSYSADGFDQYGNTLGDVTADTAFTIDPDGTCTANLCTASLEGTHTVTGSSLGATGSAVLTISSTPVDHISIDPASASIVAGASQTYTADATDADGNVLGDITGATGFTITPDGSCSGNVCTATVAGGHTVTGTSGGNTSTAALTVTPASLDHVALSPASATITSGGSQTYSAEGVGRFGNSLGDVTAGTTFTIGPDGSCTGNTCSASTAGTHTVTGHDGGKTGTASLQVAGGTLDHIVISPAPATISAGGSQSYNAEAFDAAGNALGDVTAGTTFTILPNGSCSSNVCSATVAGNHTVTGTNAGKTSSATLTIKPGTLDHLALSPSSATISAGDSLVYSAQGRDQYDNSLGDITSSTTFTIAPDGSCVGATCTATTAGAHTVTGASVGATGTAGLQVDAGALDHLVLVPGVASIVAGGSRVYAAEGRDQYENSLGNVTAKTSFAIAPDGSCSGATCTASVGGSHTVTGSDAGKSGTARLDVDAASVDHIVISPASTSIAAGGAQTYTAEAFDAADDPLGDVTGSTTFTVSPDGSCSGNVCTATVAGAHTVTGSSGANSSAADLAVAPAGLDHLVLSPASASISAGGSQAYGAEGRDRYDNSLGDLTVTTTFTIAPDGSCTGNVCTAGIDGSHTVSGSNTGKAGSATLDVSPAGLDHIVISPTTATISAGGSQSYSAEAFDKADNSLGDVTNSTSFTITPDGTCTANTCTTTTAGPHTVTGTDSSKTSSATLTVKPGPLDHLALSPGSASIIAGGSEAFSAQGRDQYDNTLDDATANTTFTIAPDGSCTAAACTATTAGGHTVTGTWLGATGSAILQVGPAAVSRIDISPDTATISAGGSQSYSAQGFDEYDNPLGDVAGSTTFAISPDGSCSANTCTATLGGPHTVNATDAGATATATLAVSYVKNSGFETDLSGWNSSGSGANVTLTRVAGGHSGNWAARLANNGTTASTWATLQDAPNWVNPTSAGTYTGTLWARSDTAGAILKLKLQEYSGSTLLGSTSAQTTLTTSWQQLSAIYTVKSPGSTLDFQAFVQNVATGTAFYADDAAIFRGSIDHIALTPASAGIAAGGSQRYSVEGFDAAGNSFGDITGSTTFTIAPDGSCNASLCTATKTGTHTITASSGGKTSMATLNVTPGPLDHLVLSPVASSIVAGGSQVYAAEGRDQFENSLGDVTAKTTFSIAPDGSCSGATCSASVGGSHTVTGSDAGKSGNATLSVDAASVDHIVVTPGSASIAAGGAQTYTAEAFDAAGNALGDVTGSTSFTISPGGSCSANVCTATTAGAHTVTASSGSNSGSASLTVVPAALDHLVLSPASASISAGGSQAYSAEGRDRYENSLGDLTAATTFTIAPDGSCSGNVCSADRDGSHTVSGSNTGTTGSATLQVTPAGLDHIVISPTNATISAGGSQSYTAEAFDSAGNSVGDVTNSTSFTVAPDGTCSANTCTAILGGPHTVTATNVGKTATATLSVSYVKNSGFETDLSGWNSSGSGANVTLTRAAGGHSGNWAARLTNNGSTNSSFATLQDAPNWVAATTAGTYTGTLWARSDTAGAILKLKLQEYSGSTLLGSTSTQTTLTTSWQQLTVTYTVKSAGSTLDFQAFVQNVATGTAFYADDAAIVRG